MDNKKCDQVLPVLMFEIASSATSLALAKASCVLFANLLRNNPYATAPIITIGIVNNCIISINAKRY